MEQTEHIRTARPHTRLTAPAHVWGVSKGGSVGSLKHEAGIYPMGRGARGTARRSTGINAKQRNPIDPRSPNLSPA